MQLTSLAKAGTQVVVPFREEDEKRHLKVTGDLGQIVPLVSACAHFQRACPRICDREKDLILYNTLLCWPPGMGYSQRRANR